MESLRRDGTVQAVMGGFNEVVLSKIMFTLTTLQGHTYRRITLSSKSTVTVTICSQKLSAEKLIVTYDTFIYCHLCFSSNLKYQYQNMAIEDISTLEDNIRNRPDSTVYISPNLRILVLKNHQRQE